jgi:hypothetical protein
MAKPLIEELNLYFNEVNSTDDLHSDPKERKFWLEVTIPQEAFSVYFYDGNKPIQNATPLNSGIEGNYVLPN